MSKEKGKTQNKKRKLTRQEKKQIDALIRQSKGDGKPHTAQDSIPFERMYKDGICRLANGRYSKCIEFEDINYQLAQPDDKTAIFEALCDMYNSFDASISVQLSLISRHANKEDFKSSITIAPQNDDFDSIRAEYTEMLQTQLERGNNGLIKTKFLTFTIEAKDIKSARARLARIETDVLNNFKLLGVSARPMTGYERLKMLADAGSLSLFKLCLHRTEPSETGRYQQHTDRQRDSERNSRKWNGFYQSDQTLLKLWIH